MSLTGAPLPLNDFDNTYIPYASKSEKDYYDNLDSLDPDSALCQLINICSDIKEMGVDAIIIDYSGGGDDGNVDDITFYVRNGDVYETKSIVDTELINRISDTSWETLYSLYGGWYNDNGGEGMICIKFTLQNTAIYIEHGFTVTSLDYDDSTAIVVRHADGAEQVEDALTTVIKSLEDAADTVSDHSDQNQPPGESIDNTKSI